MWSLHTDAGNSIHGGQYAKNVYLGETRIVTKLCLRNDPRADAEELQQYFYHSDHLGSASLISDYKGDEYQRIEYTPYGETWIERTDNKGLAYLPYKFTAKELDPETGLYYFGARYLDSKYSTWISTDPALGDYIPQAPISDEARKHNQNLPGMGGIFNHINCNLYAYGANNPVRYIDPDGNYIVFKLKDNGRYGLGSYYHGVGYCHLGTKIMSNFVPFGGFIMNLEKSLTNIDPTANFNVLYDSDVSFEIFNVSNAIDGMGFTEVGKNSDFLGNLGYLLTIYGVGTSIDDFINDKKIDNFMASLTKDPFRGCLSDEAAISLGSKLAEGALYYNKNESRLKQKGISETEWAERIRQSTNNILGDSKFESFEALENYNLD